MIGGGGVMAERGRRGRSSFKLVSYFCSARVLLSEVYLLKLCIATSSMKLVV